MIDCTQPVTYREVQTLKSHYLGKTKDLAYYRVLFLNGVDGKIVEQQGKIATVTKDLSDFKKRRADDVSFKLPAGFLSKVCFVVGTFLGITIAHNVYYRKSTREQYKQDKIAFKQAIQDQSVVLYNMRQFRSDTLQEDLPFFFWLNRDFVNKGDFTNERARNVLLELFNIKA